MDKEAKAFFTTGVPLPRPEELRKGKQRKERNGEKGGQEENQRQTQQSIAIPFL